MTPCPASQRQRKIRRHKRPCAYYSNTTATFHALLIGDLVFKLNPGPTGNCIPVVVSTRYDHRHIAQLSRPSRNPGNLININCSTRLNGHQHPMTLCTFNARSVKNKSADIVDYICHCKADLFSITETCLSADDAAVRAELCPDGYKFIDYHRFGRRGGGTGLVYRSSFGIKKVDAGGLRLNSPSGLLRHHLCTIFALLSSIVHHTLMNTESPPMLSLQSSRIISNPSYCPRSSY